MVGPRTTHLPFSQVGFGALHGHSLAPAVPPLPAWLTAPLLPALEPLAPPALEPAAELPPPLCPAFGAPAFGAPAAVLPACPGPPLAPPPSPRVTTVSSMPTICAQALSAPNAPLTPSSAPNQRRGCVDISTLLGARALRPLSRRLARFAARAPARC